mmetsp:Transcript_21824/g.35001  ORF Transcript_21824/g.35001 Transcript_21824/m.35001 type:complete len:461 (-) Transcript_21824:15-1397(-)
MIAKARSMSDTNPVTTREEEGTRKPRAFTEAWPTSSHSIDEISLLADLGLIDDETVPDAHSSRSNSSSYCDAIKSIQIRHDLTFEDFTNLEHLCDGGMSRILTADLQGISVVIKMIKAEDCPDLQGCIDALKNERAILRELDHPNVVKLLGSGTREGLPFLVLERLCGQDLASVLHRARRLRAAHAKGGGGGKGVRPAASPLQAAMLAAEGADVRLDWALQVARAMAFLHAGALGGGRSVLHRDLKGCNLGLGQDGRVRLLDFGISAVVGPGRPRLKPKQGTRSYMAPEVRAGRAYGAPCDVYSFGMLLWEVFAGKVPLGGLRAAVRRRLPGRANGPRLRPRVDPAWGDGVGALLAACWAQEPAARPGFAEVAARLAALLAERRRELGLRGPAPWGGVAGEGGGRLRRNPRSFDELYLGEQEAGRTGSVGRCPAGNTVFFPDAVPPPPARPQHKIIIIQK